MIVQATKDCPELIDIDKIVLNGISFGGYLCSSLTSHPDYKHLFKACTLYNPLLEIKDVVENTPLAGEIFSIALDKRYSEGVTAEDTLVMNSLGKI